MKRLHLRELLLVGAPVCLIGLGVILVKGRDVGWTLPWSGPVRPKIVECVVRPATPFEVFHGGDYGVTIRAQIPKDFLGVTFADFHQDGSLRGKELRSLRRLQLDGRAKEHPNYVEVENFYAFARAADIQGSSKIKANFRFEPFNRANSSLREFHQTIEFSPSEVEKPDINQSRHANFEVVGVHFLFERLGKRPYGQFALNLKNVKFEGDGTAIYPQVIGDWNWIDSKGARKSFEGRIFSTEGFTNDTTELPSVKLQLRFPGYIGQLPTRAGTQVSGLIVIGEGWPQKITFEWPEVPKPSSWVPVERNDVKFITELAKSAA